MHKNYYDLGLKNLIKQQLNGVVAVGVFGEDQERELWKNLIHNYSICIGKGKVHRLCENFGYFLVDDEKFEKGLARYFLAQSFLSGEYTADQIHIDGYNRIWSWYCARSFIREILNVPFYSQYAFTSAGLKEFAVREEKGLLQR